MEWGKVPPGVQKVKKKQVKDELDRMKQAEKKRRRLEKALATSAAIRSELEKKKQKKKEEQQRLDEEGAAIAEAVALHVLLGEDSDDSCNLMLKKDEGLNQWECDGRFDFIMGGEQAVVPHQNISKHSLQGMGLLSDANGFGGMWNGWGNSDWMLASAPLGRELRRQYFEDGGLDTAGVAAAGLIAAQAISSLQIGEETPLDTKRISLNWMCFENPGALQAALE